MLSLSPLPDRSDLKPVITGKIEQDTFTVEKLHFQSMPGLYVTANLYVPKNLTKPAPSILYVCGHGPVKTNNISYGNKVAYQHHGIWFARHGYVCLIIDTLQLGEIEGIHHGTYRSGMWWWNSRGYTPAGVEAWNSIRALDYLSTRPEVDTNRFGITGRSGGGAYSWFTAALDDRIKVAAPVAGITDLHNHVVDGVVEGHCDCMFFVNTYRWDYPQLAAMLAPRPLLFCNSDKDSIFPLEGVLRTHEKVRKLYELYGAGTNLGLLITEGPHKDTQDLQLPVFRWFNRHLKGEDPLIEVAATKLFTPQQLRVFDQLPADAINTNVQEAFVPPAPPPVVPKSAADWKQMRDEWLTDLKDKVFAGWPEDAGSLDLKLAFSTQSKDVRLDAYDFVSQPNVSLRLYAVRHSRLNRPDRVVLHALDEQDWNAWLTAARQTFSADPGRRIEPELPTPPASLVDPASVATLRHEWETGHATFACVAPRGIGPTAWTGDAKKQIQIRRRFMLLGQTLDSMHTWDIRCAIQALRAIKELKEAPLWLQGEEQMAVNVLNASLFEPGVAGLSLSHLPKSYRDGPDYLNVLRVLDVPQTVTMAAERSQVRLFEQERNGWEYPIAVSQRLGWNVKQFIVEPSPSTSSR
jgi:dienelactone hydrolase